VGKTAAALATAGIELRADNTAYFTKNSSTPVLVNRVTTDGDLIQFRKDNTTVGSIGTYVNLPYIGKADVNLLFDPAGPHIIPRGTNGGARDAAINLGASTNRFKDLYLSGSVSGGGTYRAGNTGTGNIILEGGQHIFRLGVGGGYAERARIDTSGNLLVGTTDTAPATNNVEGIVLRSEGHINVSRAGGVVGYFNRKTNDGTILDFRKDGTTVGSIGNSGINLMIGKGDTGLGFSSSADAVFPIDTSTGNNRSSAIDLGASTAKFKDLYLSGGVYLGGTGAANKLDDYESGTWTPTVNSGTFSTIYARYTKVGARVFIDCRIDLTGTRTTTGFNIGGLPFTSKVNNYTTGAVVASNYTGGGDWLAALSVSSATFVVFQEQGSDALGTEFGNGYLMFSLSYEAA
jgi:hypothetical protein